MKQLELTPQIQELIANAVGPDVSTAGLAVFEAIATNSLPLPGKGGSIFQGAVIAPITLTQMAESINSGDSLPLILSHDMSGIPVGRVFYSNVMSNNVGVSELRALFYVDQTEADLITKLNAGSLDEVSVSFLPTQITCSSCGFDYMGDSSSPDNLWDMTCDQGHKIGDMGVYANLVGLSRFIELSLVTRGAADGAKIVGKSASKLQPSMGSMRLAAQGYTTDALICRASQGEPKVMNIDVNKLVVDLSTSMAQATTLQAELTAKTNEVSTLEASLTEVNGRVVTLTAERDAFAAQLAASPSNQIKTDHDAAVVFLQETAKKVLIAANAQVPAPMPATAVELSELITQHTTALSAVLPIGGRAKPGEADNRDKPSNLAAFKMAPGK